MTASIFEAPAGIIVSLSILVTIAWMLQQCTGNSGWIDTIWTFSLRLGLHIALRTAAIADELR